MFEHSESIKTTALSGEPITPSAFNFTASSTSSCKPITDDQPYQEQSGDLKDFHNPHFYIEPQQERNFPRKPPMPVSDPIVSLHTEFPPPAVTLDKKGNSEPPDVWEKERRSLLNVSAQTKSQLSGLRQLYFRWVTAYRLFIGLTFVINAIVLSLLITLDFRATGILETTAINILVAVLVRQEDLINLSFSLLARISSSFPLSLRRIIASSHHYGGIHVGCALSALMWYDLCSS
jgi:hypothetical protein